MKKIGRIMFSALISCGILMQGSVFAAEFSDMPDNWTTQALEHAVENGLLNGADGMIMPDNNITRAEMAAIIVRAFGAEAEADISAFPDMSAEKWYYSEFAKAVYMQAFSGTDDGKLNPESPITYEECFTVVSRVFDLSDSDAAILDTYADGAEIAEWAKPYAAKVVGNGYWTGNEGKLKPQSQYITRSEFAVLMDNMVKTYINEPGEYSEFTDGNILIRSEGVTLKGYAGDDLIIIGDGVSEITNLTDINSENKIVTRGGTVVVTGTINNISALSEGVVLDISQGVTRNGRVYVAKGSKVLLGDVTAMPTN